MECLFQRHWHTTVRRQGDKRLWAETVYHDTAHDMVAGMQVNTGSAIIEQAQWEQHRPVVPVAEEPRAVPELIGIEAYFNSGPQLTLALAGYGNPLMGQLFAETVKGVIQAESFTFRERGYQTAAEYSRFWRDFYTGTCRYYSNLDRVQQEWYEHVGTTTRTGVLFSRFIAQTLYREPAGRWLLQGTFNDSFHELAVSILINPEEGSVDEISGRLLRCPDQVCREAAVFLPELKGTKLGDLTKKDIASFLGRNQGCVHLIDLTFDLAYALRLYDALR